MPIIRTRTTCLSGIKRINRRFRKLKKQNGPVAERLRREKDRFIDQMAALCYHLEVIGTRGAKAYGPMKVRVAPHRICTKCGYCEAGGFKTLRGKPVTMLPLSEYIVEQGLILKRLGINV